MLECSCSLVEWNKTSTLHSFFVFALLTSKLCSLYIKHWLECWDFNSLDLHSTISSALSESTQKWVVNQRKIIKLMESAGICSRSPLAMIAFDGSLIAYWRSGSFFHYFHIRSHPKLADYQVNKLWHKLKKRTIRFPWEKIKVMIHKNAFFSNLCFQINVTFIQSILAWIEEGESDLHLVHHFMQTFPFNPQFIIYTMRSELSTESWVGWRDCGGGTWYCNLLVAT